MPEMTEQDDQAVKVWNLVSNGMGGIDGALLPIAIARYGVKDVAGLIDRLVVIRKHRPQGEDK